MIKDLLCFMLGFEVLLLQAKKKFFLGTRDARLWRLLARLVVFESCYFPSSSFPDQSNDQRILDGHSFAGNFLSSFPSVFYILLLYPPNLSTFRSCYPPDLSSMDVDIFQCSKSCYPPDLSTSTTVATLQICPRLKVHLSSKCPRVYIPMKTEKPH